MQPAPTLDDLYRDVADDLNGVEDEIRTSLADDIPDIREMTAHASRHAGKRLRPAMVLIIARATGGITARHVRLAAVVEMIHLATLVHDDVIDGADLRRNNATVNAAWGNYEAVLLGDIIFARAINLLARLQDQRSLLRLTEAVDRLCTGEILQNRHQRDAGVSEELYYRIIDAKTAELYSRGCQLSGHLSGAGEAVVKGLDAFGRELGLAFQVIDDCLDLVGDEHIVGKSLGTDLSSGKMTLPLILCRGRADARVRGLLDRVVSGTARDGESSALVAELRRGGFVDEAMARAREHVARGIASAHEVLPLESHAAFEAIGEFVLRRKG